MLQVESRREKTAGLQKGIRWLLALIIGLAGLLPAGGQALYAADGTRLRLNITPMATEIDAGATAQFRVELTNISGANLPNVELRLPVSGPVAKLRAAVDASATQNVLTDRVAVRESGVLWRGGLRSDGILVIVINVRTSPQFGAATAELSVNGQAGPVDGATDVSDSAVVTVNGAAPVNTDELKLEKSIIVQGPDGELTTTSGPTGIAPQQQVGIQLELTNSSDQTVYSLIVDEMAPTPPDGEAASAGAGRATENSEADSCRIRLSAPRIVDGRGMAVPGEALTRAGFSAMNEYTYGFLIATPANSSSTVRVRAQATGTAGCEFGGQAEAFVTNLPPAANGQFDAQSALALLPQFQQFPSIVSALVVLFIITNDFGDAPDSSNHAGVAMDAYPGVPNARFPTVFDPATGLPQGPVHRNPYALRLGAQVSWEFSADLGPRRNIDPPTNTPNLDLHDDGIDPATLAFQHCLTTLIPYEVNATQLGVNALASQNGTAYVNVWLDGNRDGDWEDTLNCDGLSAREHIVIDQAITISAPGTLNLVLPTGNLPIPQNGQDEDMWLRITLSDQPSEKSLGSGTAGDGRGPASGFRLGETEDYLYSPPSAAPPPAARGADSELELESVIEIDELASAPTLNAAEVDSLAPRNLNTIIRLRNRGDLPTGNVRLVVESQPYLGVPESADVKCCQCLTCTVASAVVTAVEIPDALPRVAQPAAAPFREVCDENGENCRLIADLGFLNVGENGRLHVRWALPAAVTQDVMLNARLETVGDVNPANDARQLLAQLPIRQPQIVAPGNTTLGWTGCLTCTVAAGANSLVADFQVRGFAEPNSTLRLVADGLPGGSVTVTTDADGFWQTTAGLPDGSHELVAEYVEVNGLPPAEVARLDKSSTKLLLVDSTLPWNPASLGFLKIDSIDGELVRAAENDDSCGPWQFQDDLGRTDADGWRVPVYPGSHEMGVELLCSGPAGAALKLGEETLVMLTDDDADGRYTGSFSSPNIAEATPVELVVTCNDVETAYAGSLVPVTPATVSNAATGEPLAGVEVTLWQRNEDRDGAKYAAWEAQAFGQTNPQSTNSQGEFSYILPPGGYGLTAQIDGFQPFRAGPLRLQGVFPSRNFMLMPLPDAGPAAQIAITEEGFDPPAITIPVGTTVAWTNRSLQAAGSAAMPATVQGAAVNAATWESGRLLSGAEYRFRFSEPGTYVYVNSEDPGQQATIIVGAAPATSVQVFMPIVTK